MTDTNKCNSRIEYLITEPIVFPPTWKVGIFDLIPPLKDGTRYGKIMITNSSEET